MKTIELKITALAEREAMHDILAEAFAFPEYYGRNLDALYDCLTDISKETEVHIDYEGLTLGNVPPLTISCLKTLYDAAEENDHLHIITVG